MCVWRKMATFLLVDFGCFSSVALALVLLVLNSGERNRLASLQQLTMQCSLPPTKTLRSFIQNLFVHCCIIYCPSFKQSMKCFEEIGQLYYFGRNSNSFISLQTLIALIDVMLKKPTFSQFINLPFLPLLPTDWTIGWPGRISFLTG